MWNWFKRFFKIGVAAYEIKNPDVVTKEILDEVVEEMDKVGAKEK